MLSLNQNTANRVLVAIFLASLFSCSLMRVPTYETKEKSESNLFKRKTIVENAQSFLSRKYINVDGKNFNYDCSGFVLAVYYKSGIDIQNSEINGAKSNMVRSVYDYTEKNGIIYGDVLPKPGDLVFFENTKGHSPGILTHIGIVEKIEQDGTVAFIHKSSRGIRRDFLNLNSPSSRFSENDEITNSYLRRRRSKDSPGSKYLAGELFAGYGNIIDDGPIKNDSNNSQDSNSSTQPQQIQ